MAEMAQLLRRLDLGCVEGTGTVPWEATVTLPGRRSPAALKGTSEGDSRVDEDEAGLTSTSRDTNDDFF